MRTGWNPARRNRNIGTKAHGRGANNRHVIPESYHTLRRFYEVLGRHVRVTRQLGLHVIDFLVEPPRPGWIYPCTVDEVCEALSHLPCEDVGTFRIVVMRQPTRRQRLLCPVWGRAAFHFDVDGLSGPAVVIESQSLEPIKWSSSLDPERARELARLRMDGHRVEKTRRHTVIHPSPSALRSTVLFRTLLHEVGHHVDARGLSDDQWDSKPRLEKEDFAHRYAAAAAERVRSKAVLPIVQAIDEQSLNADGLLPEWFRL